MTALTGKFPNYAVYYEATGTSSFGEATFAAGREIRVRVEEKTEDTLGDNDELIRTNHTMYVQEDLVKNSVIWIGKLTDVPDPINDLLVIRVYEKIPNYNGKKFERVVKLKRFRDKLVLT